VSLNPWAAVLLVISWGVIAVTTSWCFYRMLTEGKRDKGE
jgi:hypothetical protein